jgi:hypothetical protein
MTKHQELARAEMRMDSRSPAFAEDKFRGDYGTLAFRLSDKFRHHILPA